MRSEFFKLVSMYADSIQNAVQSVNLMISILQKATENLETASSVQETKEFSDIIYELHFKGSELFKQSDELLTALLAMYLRLSQIPAKENRQSA